MKKFLVFLIFLFLFSTKVFALDKVEINSATLQQLDTLTGIGPVYAQRIIDNRPYSSLDDLLRVKGIGPATLQKIKDQGVACVNCKATESPATAENTAPVNNTTPKTTPAPEPDIALSEPKEAISYPKGIFINEVMPNPSGADETLEWAEIFNSNNFDVDLSDWKIQDQQGTITTYTIPSNTKISANGFLVFKRPDTNIMLNNDSDGLNLLTPDGKTENSMAFTSAPLNQSYSKTNSGWQWSANATPGTANIITAIAAAPKNKTQIKTASAKLLQTDLPKTNISDNNNVETSDNSQNPWFLFFTVLAVGLISAFAVLFIKLKIFQKNVRT